MVNFYKIAGLRVVCMDVCDKVYHSTDVAFWFLGYHTDTPSLLWSDVYGADNFIVSACKPCRVLFRDSFLYSHGIRAVFHGDLVTTAGLC
jgi:hypothetical protein